MNWWVCLLGLVVAVALLGCGRDRQGCDVSYSQPVNRQTSENNGKCRVGEVLVGYDANAVGGPLICAKETVSCSYPGK